MDSIERVIEEYRLGRMVIITDHEDRENEGDLAIATEKLTPEAMSFMMREGRGLVCVSISFDTAEKLKLPLQTLNNNSLFQTPFAVSIDHREVLGVGVTAQSRTRTMLELLNPQSRPDDFVSPGHVFPLIANPSGVLARRGQTEGCYDLARIAGFKASGVICEIMNPDGSMMRGEALNAFARKHGLAMTSVDEIARYRISKEVRVREVSSELQDTDFGRFLVKTFVDEADGLQHLALMKGDTSAGSPLVRIHSECLTGDVFGSRRCDCGGQLADALRQISESPGGILLYLRQEGRGIGLLNKIRAYHLQDQGHDTVEANVELGFAPDERDFAVAAKMLLALGVDSIRLLTNNPRKLDTLSANGVSIVERIPVTVPADEYSRSYLEAKREKLGHLL